MVCEVFCGQQLANSHMHFEVCRLTCDVLQAQRRSDAAEEREAHSAAQLADLTSKLSAAEDEIIALEGQISILEQELAKYNQEYAAA
jgi:polyhydroxyalkanoate synthesis regulator phasin